MTAAFATTPIQDVLDYILNDATDRDMERILVAYNTRSKHLRAVRAAKVEVGSTVMIDKITPKALVGLVGEVVKIDGAHAHVRLDKASTTTLANSRIKMSRFVPRGADHYVVTGVPLSCCTQP